MLNKYPNLPGILTEFKDGGLQLRTDPTPPLTESILLLGTAVDGPIGVPVAVDSTTFEEVFGKAVDKNGRPNGATLPVGFEEAWNAGCRDIRLMRISGSPALAVAEHAEATNGEGLRVVTINGGSLYNQAKLFVKEVDDEQLGTYKLIQLELPPAKRRLLNDPPLEYSSLDYPTLRELADAINNDPNNTIFYAEADGGFEDKKTSDLLTKDGDDAKFDGGDDGINLTSDQMFELLGGKRDLEGNLIEQGAYQLLENYTVDWIVPLGVYADDILLGPKKNFAQQLAMACAYISVRQNTTYGVIATRSPRSTNLRAISEHVDDLVSRRNDYYILDKNEDPIFDAEGNLFDIGQYVQVLAGPDVIVRNSRLGQYYTNSPVIYAAMMSTMRPGSSPLNKQVPGVLGLRYTYSNSQRDRLTAGRYVTYKTKANGAIVAVEDAMTCAQPGSDYTRVSTCRVVKAAVDMVKAACDPFLGEPNTLPNRNSMAAAIDKRLSQIKEAGDLSDYSFNIIATVNDLILGKANIELTLVPPFELRQITVVVRLSTEA